MSFPEADFQPSTTESPLGNRFPTEVDYIKGGLTNVRVISLISLNRHAGEQKNKLFTDTGNVMAALSTTLTLPSSASVTVFSWSCLPCILLCSCQRALAFSLRTSAKFSGFIWWAPCLPPLQHLIGLTL